MKSKITGGKTEILFTAKILNKYDVKYYRCKDTGFIQTEEPYWLEEAYSSAITKLDIGLPFRNEELRDKIIPIINNHFNGDAKFLDYAGGYGLFTRLMRDKGFEFYHTDKFCQNIFAEYFDLENLNSSEQFEVVTAFEVFEHLPNPMAEIENMLSIGNNLLFTTELQPQTSIKSVNDWWYFIPETGQHISLFTKSALEYIADRFGYYFYTDNYSTHLFTRKELKINPFLIQKDPWMISIMKRKVNQYMSKQNPKRDTLLQKDWLFISNKLRN